MTLVWPAGAWLAGSVAGALGLESWWPVLLLGGVGVSLGLAITGQRLRYPIFVAVMVALALGGVARYEVSQPSPQPGGVALYNDGEAVTLRGVVVDEPEERDTTQRLHLSVNAVQTRDGTWQPIDGDVLVTARLFPRFEYGDELVLRATKLRAPPVFDGFDYREYLASRGIVSLAAFPAVERTGSGGGSPVLRLAGELRRPLGDSLERSLPEPKSALARGILLGQRASIPQEVEDDFNAAGISHLVAISGYNVMLVAGFVTMVLTLVLNRRPATLAAMVAVVVYAVFVGGSPSVLRATFMAWVVLGATLFGRPNSGLSALLLAGAVLTAVDPQIVDDVSFQLSFFATLGIVLWAKGLQRRFESLTAGAPALRLLAEPASLTIAASVAAQPVIGWHFERLALWSLPANLVAGVLFPVILATSALTAVAGVVSDSMGRLVGEIAYWPLAMLVLIGRTVADWPAASFATDGVSVLTGVVVFAVVVAGVSMLARRPVDAEAAEVRTPRLQPVLYMGVVVAALAGFVWFRALVPGGEDELTVSILDVGQGDAILIETGAGHRILVDGGPSGNRLMQALGAELPSGVRRIDLMVLTHGQDDHVTGLIEVLERYDVASVLMSPMPGTSRAYAAWREAVASEGAAIREAVAGEWLDLGGGVRIEVMGPPPDLLRGTGDDVNNSSVVLRLVQGEISFLLTGDLAEEGEEALLQSTGSLMATVLKVGHHGSDGSSSPRFLAAVQPRLAIMSLGADNSYGHPSPTTRLRLAGVPLLRTDLNGTVRLRTDGRRLEVEFQRGAVSGGDGLK